MKLERDSDFGKHILRKVHVPNSKGLFHVVFNSNKVFLCTNFGYYSRFHALINVV